MKNLIHLQRLLTDANRPETFRALLPEIDFRQIGNTYRARQSSGLVLRKDRDDVWHIVNHSSKLPYESGSLLSFVAKLNHLDLKQYDDLRRAAALICQAADLRFENYNIEGNDWEKPPTPSVSKPVSTSIWLPNTGNELKKSFQKYELANAKTPQYKAVAAYLNQKTGVNSDQLSAFGVFPAASHAASV